MVTIDKINQILTNFCAEVIREPLLYFSEADLHALLYHYFMNEFGGYIKTGYQRGSSSKSVYQTRRIHREYGMNNSNGNRVDLVIFPEDEIKEIDSANLTMNQDYITPYAAFELGTEKSTSFSDHIKGDLEKLNKLIYEGCQRGYYIHFFRDTTLSASNTQSRENTEDKINNEIREVAKTINDKRKPGVCVLLFIIRISRKNQQKIWGKFEIYDVTEKTWKKINTDKSKEKLESGIMEVLNKQSEK